jgi:epoxide hydrolase A/B
MLAMIARIWLVPKGNPRPQHNFGPNAIGAAELVSRASLPNRRQDLVDRVRNMASEITHRSLETNGIRMHIAEAGAGPLVLLCHGFPESWYSWRHQLPALAAAGFHAVAPDMRGYGLTDRPQAIEDYTLFHLVGDMLGLVDALGADNAVIAGHDWGAPVAWLATLLRPDCFRGVVGLSVPFRPRGKVRPTTAMPQTADAVWYQLYFQGARRCRRRV